MLRHLVFLSIQNKPDAILLIRSHLEALSEKMPGCTQFYYEEYPYALKIAIKSGAEPLRLSKAASFWVAPHRRESTQEHSPSQSLLKSRL